MESFPLSRVLPLYHCSLACKSVSTIVYARGGFGGHILSGRYQSFIPACNSTTVKGEMARLGRTADRFPEKLKCQTFEWKTDLADIMSTNHHHLYLFVCSRWYLSNFKPNVPFESDVLFNQRFHRISSRLRLQLPN